MGKVLVTGGAGFIGSHLVDRLLKDGCDVVVLDDFSTGRPQNLEHHKNNRKLKLVQIDISEYSKIEKFFKNVDWVFHLAALADIVPSIKKPFKYHKSNVNGTISVLEASRVNEVKRFVYAASSSCYGIPDQYPTPETAEIRTEYPYALTKNIAEQYVIHWGKIYGLPVVSLRMFNVYGPRSRTSGTYGAVFGVFLAQKLHNKPFTVVGNGNQTRDFTFVSDIVDAYIQVAESDMCNEIFNLGSGQTYSINRLVELLGGDILYVPKRPGEPDCTFAEISKIQKMIGWKAVIPFENGVQTMLDNIDYWQEAPVWTPEKIKEATREWFQYLGK
ncbi:SDR family oxidoreductase [Desulfobacula toluolica]|uniref:Predicted UDP-glucose 4-epimerase n=1 Tax=Desulfobacula toluolica (strain DSM 7467 / Tol2) TaxID=651182 RepID=K0NRT9_DESTT|nr:SDR family oxidoreductase [Desulfobacula toluolica]CCK81677.1 predicted UDP-glucose 4-epimerase [Desulfobacula toluolica Tol2]